MAELCVCAKKPQPLLDLMSELGMSLPENVHPDSGFFLQCGKCYDPCGLKWKMDKKEGEEDEYDMMDAPPPPPPGGPGGPGGPFGMPPQGLPRVVESLLSVAMDIVEKSMPDGDDSGEEE